MFYYSAMDCIILICLLTINYASGYIYNNVTSSPLETQLLDFKLLHPKPIGLLTVGSGSPVEIRDLISMNSDLLRHEYFFDSQTHIAGERVPERILIPKGTAFWGYFQVTHDVSKYTRADVFNGIGKKTPFLGRLGTAFPEKGGSDVQRDPKAFSTKFYTKEGNLDFLCLNIPFFLLPDPIDFNQIPHLIGRNPRTHLLGAPSTSYWDMLTLRPQALEFLLYLLSDYGLPDGWRHMDAFPVYTYELHNKHGERWYARFNFRTELGLRNLTSQEAQQIQSTDLDYYIRDMYNAIENKNYPSWRLEMDVLSLHDVQHVDFNPFDPSTTWRRGSYHTVPIGRLTFTRNSDNQFRDQEQAAFNPVNLVPGISSPIDALFRGNRVAYRDAQNYRIGRNHLKVGVNAPLYAKSYVRDGHPPVGDNGRDAPNYYPNSYNGPVPYVDDVRPRENLEVLGRNAVDLQSMADFYNEWNDEGGRQRLVENTVNSLLTVTNPTRSRAVRLLKLIDRDLGSRVIAGLKLALKRNRG